MGLFYLEPHNQNTEFLGVDRSFEQQTTSLVHSLSSGHFNSWVCKAMLNLSKLSPMLMDG